MTFFFVRFVNPKLVNYSSPPVHPHQLTPLCACVFLFGVGFGGAGSPQGGATVAVAGLTSTAAFVPLVIQCASNPHYLARAASSRALAALVPPVRASGVIAELLRRLPKDAADDRCFGAGAHNHIHGGRSER